MSQVDRLRADVAALPLSGEGSWRDFLVELRHNIADGDPTRFLEWSIIQGTMFIGDTGFARSEFAQLRRDDRWRDRWRPAAAEEIVGAPRVSRRLGGSSGNAIHHVFHLREFERTTGLAVHEFDHVIEVGGGYGSMCRIVHRLGHRGTYTIVDFPELLALQRFYLGALGLDNVDFRTDLPANRPTGRILYIATWSLSEMPLETRALLGPQSLRPDAVLMAFQPEFDGVDNAHYFEHLRHELALTHEPVDIPHIPPHRYLLASRQAGL